MAAKFLRGPVGSQVKLFLAFAVIGATLSAIAAMHSWWIMFYASLAFLAASPYIASLLVYIKLRRSGDYK
ncbi:MAG: hypothetical protein LRS46_01355 [Desulfurococcales archaeon]|nr:hypothetical protein [Desulfurococcales archaeon]